VTDVSASAQPKATSTSAPHAVPALSATAERRRYDAGELTHRVTLGEVVEQALAALERERAQHGGGKR